MRADEHFASIPAMAITSGTRFGDATAMVDGSVRLSFQDVAEAMQRVGRALMACGVEVGDRVALWAPNSAVFTVAALGIQACGAWLVPLNTRFKADEAAYIVEAADARVIMAVEDFLGTDYRDVLVTGAPRAVAGRQMVSVPSPGSLTCPPWESFLATSDDVSETDLLARLSAITGDDVCDIIYTSGTTGTPKGVMLRHGASLRAFEAYNAGMRIKAGDRAAIAVPFFHCFGYKAGWMLDLLVGATSYPVPVFEPEAMMQLISSERITHMGGPPTMFQSMLDHPNRPDYDLSSLRSVNVSAASVDPQLIRRLIAGGVTGAISSYGLTENHAVVSVADPDGDPEVTATTVGRVLDGIEVGIFDDDGKPVPAGTSGEIWVSGYAVMTGYFRDQDATEATVVDGWLHTGDIGVLDADGSLRITDRKKDLFVMGGFNVSPVEVERAIEALEPVAEVAVVGMPDPTFGEVGAAFVVAKPGTTVDPDEATAYLRQHLANFKVPRRIEVVATLPRNASGKVLKPELRRWLREHPAVPMAP